MQHSLRRSTGETVRDPFSQSAWLLNTLRVRQRLHVWARMGEDPMQLCVQVLRWTVQPEATVTVAAKWRRLRRTAVCRVPYKEVSGTRHSDEG